jgi:hypothetical protein
MGKHALLVALCLLLCGLAPACRSKSSAGPPAAPPQGMPQGLPSAPKELTDFFDAKIRAEWDAIAKKDKKALGELLDDNYVAVEADREGERFKPKVLNELDRGNVASYTLSFLKVTPLGPDAAFVRYEVFMRFPPGSTQPYLKVLVGEIWVRRNGEWKALHYQESAVK